MKSVNYVYYHSDEAVLMRLEEEYKMIGRDVQRFSDRIVVFAFPRKKQDRNHTTQSKNKKSGRRSSQS